MPWRAEPGQHPDPYRVWLSEIMLQQTTVAAVIPYFKRFVARFPTIQALAEAPAEHVMEAWAGLGYYARARNLHACARMVAVSGGAFPETLETLMSLPGIGSYTAAAIASIAFGHPVIPVDGNVERVAARVFAVTEPLPGAKARIALLAQRLGDDEASRRRPADYTQALFDLGATVCTPRSPACVICPWCSSCRGHLTGAPEQLPIKSRRAVRPTRYGVRFWLEDIHENVLLIRREAKGLLGGMLELPGAAWAPVQWESSAALDAAPQAAEWRHAGHILHGFTHFQAFVDVYRAVVPCIIPDGEIRAISALATAALPRVMHKCIELARFTSC